MNACTARRSPSSPCGVVWVISPYRCPPYIIVEYIRMEQYIFVRYFPVGQFVIACVPGSGSSRQS